MISLIAAISENNCIAKDGHIPWDIPADMKFFKEKTLGHTVVMGRKTWEAIPPQFQPLPNRTNIVVTKNIDYSLPEHVIKHTILSDALIHAPQEELFVIGGGEIYAETIAVADMLYITHVHQTIDGDIFFPEINKNEWIETWREDHDGFSFVIYKRK